MAETKQIWISFNNLGGSGKNLQFYTNVTCTRYRTGYRLQYETYYRCNFVPPNGQTSATMSYKDGLSESWAVTNTNNEWKRLSDPDDLQYKNYALDAWDDTNITATTTIKLGYPFESSTMTDGGTSVTFTVPAYYTNPSVPTLTINNNGNNTFSISATEGASGNNNPATGVVIEYSYNNSTWYSYTNNDLMTVTYSTTIYARAYTKGEQSNSGYTYDSEYISYTPPWSPIGKPTLNAVYNKDNTVSISGALPNYESSNPVTESRLICTSNTGRIVADNTNPTPDGKISPGLSWNHDRWYTVKPGETSFTIRYTCTAKYGDPSYAEIVLPIYYVVRVYIKALDTFGTLYARKSTNDKFALVKELYQNQQGTFTKIN